MKLLRLGSSALIFGLALSSISCKRPPIMVQRDTGMMMEPDAGVIDLMQPPAMAVLTTSNPGDLIDDKVTRVGADLAGADSTLDISANVTSVQSVTLGDDGYGYVTFDAPEDVGGIMVVTDLDDIDEDGAVGGRYIQGDQTALQSPKGVAIANTAGWILVADVGAGDIKAFEKSASGNVAPAFTVSDLGGRSVWDIYYDEARSRLFAAGTDGSVIVYDDFENDRGASGPTRTIVPYDGGAQISVNLHGIYYSYDDDLLIVSDVGDAADATDGQIFTIAAASMADGDTPIQGRIYGDQTELGNPVDIAYGRGYLYIAEKSNDYVLRYDDVIALVGDRNEPADYQSAVTKAESVQFAGGVILASANPGEFENDAVVRLSLNLDVTLATLNGFVEVVSLQSTTVDSQGYGYVTYDRQAGYGGIMGFSDLPGRMGDGPLGTANRNIAGADTLLKSPKGLTVSNDRSLMFVADVGAEAIFAFNLDDTGNVAPAYSIDNLLFGAPAWDVAYDDANDRLFAAETRGRVLVFDTVTADQGAPDRNFFPVNEAGDRLSVNLHGIVYVPEVDILLLSDVGDAENPNDGQIFIVEGASEASGVKVMRAQIGGAMTNLGNPVDISFDGKDLYVAEKSNDYVLRFDDVLNLTGMNDIAPAAQYSVTKAESVQILR